MSSRRRVAVQASAGAQRPAGFVATVAALALVCLLPARAGAAAGQTTDPRVLLQTAIEHFSSGDFDRSRAVLELALRQRPPARLRGRIELYLGLNAAAENRAAAAQQHFRRALLADPWLVMDPDRHKRSFVDLFDAVRRRLLGELHLTVRAPVGQVSVDGLVVGTGSELRRRLVAGAYRLEVRGPTGTLLFDSQVRVTAGQTTRVVVARPRAEPGGEGAAAGPSGGGAKSDGPGRDRPRRLWTWVVAGGAVVSAAVAVGLGLSASADHDEACGLLADDSVPCTQRTRLIDPSYRSEYLDLKQSMESKRLGSGIVWGLTGALAVGAAVLFWYEGRGDEADPSPAVQLAPALRTSRGLVVQGRF